MFLTSSTLNLTVLSLTLNCNHSNTNRARTQVQRCLDDRRADEPNYRSRGFAKFLWSSDQDQDDGEYEVTKGQGAVYVLSLSLSHPIKVTHTHTNPNSYISVEDRSRYTYDQVREKIFETSAGRDVVHVTISSEFVPDREVPVESYIREWNLVCLNREGRVVILTRKQSDVIYNDDPPRFTYVVVVFECSRETTTSLNPQALEYQHFNARKHTGTYKVSSYAIRPSPRCA